MSNFIVFVSPWDVSEKVDLLREVFDPLEKENVLYLSQVRILLYSDLQKIYANKICTGFAQMQSLRIEDENIGGKEMLNALKPLPGNANTFEELVSHKYSEDVIELLKVIGTVMKDTVNKYLDISKEGLTILVIVPAIFAVAYGLAVLSDCWDILDSDLKKGGLIFEQTNQEVLLLQHLR